MPCPLPGDLPYPGIKPRSPYGRWILDHLSHQGSPRILECVAYPFCRGYPDPRIKLGSPALLVDSLPVELPGKAKIYHSNFFLSESESRSVCPTVCDPMDYIVHGILQARIAVLFSRGSFQPRSPPLQVDSLPAEPQKVNLNKTTTRQICVDSTRGWKLI